MTVAYAVGMLAWKWLKEANEPLSGTVDPVLAEAVEIVQHDSLFITVKLHRALHGRDEHDLENDGDDHPIQNDWNGSAKVALICLERSEAAWRTIAHATTDETPRAIAEQLHDLRNQVNEAFPDAWSFIRPGFDEPDRWRG
jgi:hypothetical protein